MHRRLAHLAFGWLILTGILHFSIDVVSHAVQGRYPAGSAAALYFGLHCAFAFGQIFYGGLALLVIRQAPQLAKAPFFALSLSAGIAWFLIAWMFIEYPQPRLAMFGYLLLLVCSALHGRWSL